MKEKKYDNYWKLTLWNTDFFETEGNFVSYLSKIKEYIDLKYSTNAEIKYKELQDVISNYVNNTKDGPTIRKIINQYFKLGFINNNFSSYHPLLNDFLKAKELDERVNLFSKIVYENSAFNRSFSHPDNERQIDYILKTLMFKRTLSKKELASLMFANKEELLKGYLTEEEINKIINDSSFQTFYENKYNQIYFLENLLKKISGVKYSETKKLFMLEESVEEIVDEENKISINSRDSYKQFLFKKSLENEIKNLYNTDEPFCVIEKFKYPYLIASHIIPWKICNKEFPEKSFDKDNGILLSKNMDSLFDKGLITFDEYGQLLISNKLKTDENFKKYLTSFKIDEKIYNLNRRNNMNFHRKYIFQK